MQHGTIKEAAKNLNISERAIYNRMKEREFKEEYARAKSEITRGTVLNINNRIANAIETINSIMIDTNNNPAIRLQAAQTLLNTACKFASRLEAEEQNADTKQDKNPFDFSF